MECGSRGVFAFRISNGGVACSGTVRARWRARLDWGSETATGFRRDFRYDGPRLWAKDAGAGELADAVKNPHMKGC